MKHYLRFLFTFILACLTSSLISCISDEDYSLSPNDKLTFSKDTISFDTIITDQATNTYTFQVYNYGNKPIRLTKVYLEKGIDSPFKVNVDGTFLENGYAVDFEIGSKDSIRVFLFLNAPQQDQDEPTNLNEKLFFMTEGGSLQEVVLTANGQDVIRMKGLCIQKDTLFSSKRPFHILDSLVVEKDAVLQIAPGTRLYFHPNASLIVKGTVLALGEENNMIQMRGDRLGYMFSEQPYDRIPGQWGGIHITSDSYLNVFQYCDIHSGSYGIKCDSSDVEIPKVSIENSIIHNTLGDVLTLRNSNIFVGNSQLSNAGGNCVTIRGGKNIFVHCTIANFFAFTGGDGVALDFANYDGNVRLPIVAAEFYNSIITGYASDEIMGSQSEEHPDDAFNYYFHHCLLNTPEFEDARLKNCFWESKEQEVKRADNFSPAFDLKKLIFTFELNEKSQAVGNADFEITKQLYPFDRVGKDRLENDSSDIGCYEYLINDSNSDK